MQKMQLPAAKSADGKRPRENSQEEDQGDAKRQQHMEVRGRAVTFVRHGHEGSR